MSGKKSEFGLIIKLLAALVIGAVIGRVAGEGLMDALVSFKYVIGQLIFFAVPLVIVGFIAPAIARLGQNASKMLLTAVALAYLSSVGAAFFSAFSGYAIIPHLSIPTTAEGLVALPKPSFVLNIPPLMSVMSALVTALLLGLAANWAKAETMMKLLDELERIMTNVVVRLVIPLLPFFVGTTFCELSYEGRLTEQLPIFLLVILIVILGHYVWLGVLFAIGGILSGRSPWQVIRYYLPAYLTAVGTMSSAATLPVSKDCCHELGADDEIASFVLPLGATINMDGTAIYQCVATIFLATCCGMNLTIGQMITVVVTATLASIGTAGVSGAGMLMLAMVLTAMGIPVDMIMIIYGVDRLFDMGRTCLNVAGDISGTLCISAWESKKTAKK